MSQINLHCSLLFNLSVQNAFSWSVLGLNALIIQFNKLKSPTNAIFRFRSMKLQCELYPSRHVALCLDPYCGLGFALWCLSSVYSGHHTLLIPPSEVESNPAVWLTAVSQYKVRDTFCSYGEWTLLLKLDTVYLRQIILVKFALMWVWMFTRSYQAAFFYPHRKPRDYFCKLREQLLTRTVI